MERRGERGTEEQIHDLWWGVARRQPERCAQRLDCRPPLALADVSAPEIKIGLAEFRVFVGCVFEIGNCRVEAPLIEQGQTAVGTVVPWAEPTQRRAGCREHHGEG